jgi:anti-anti-sigma factor
VTEVPFAITFDAASGTLTVAGDVDEHNAAGLREGIEKHSQMYSLDTVLDLTAVTFLPSTAVGVLVRADQEFAVAGTRFELAAASGTIAERVLTVCAMPHRAY